MKGALFMVLCIPLLALADLPKASAEARAKLLVTHGQAQIARIDAGLAQIAPLWTKEDGTDADFATFAAENFIADPRELDAAFAHLDKVFESMDGHYVEMGRDLRWYMDVETGPMLKVDYILSEYDPSSHVTEDLFKNKLAFFLLLNFEAPSLDRLTAQGEAMDRLAWAKARLAQRFTARVPAAVQQEITRAYVQGDDYINNYNFYLGNLADASGKTLYPKGFGKLISHWGLRDELKAQYKNADGLARQKLIYDLMLRIIDQKVPQEAINGPDFTWNLAEALPKGSKGFEPDTRYQTFLNIFKAVKLADPYVPKYPTHIQRKFNREREIPEARVEALFTSVCSSPTRQRIATLIAKKLGRPLEPFDIWYSLKPGPSLNEGELDKITAAKYRTAADFQNAVPGILHAFGFSDEDAAFISRHIQVDNARGIGHALGAQRPDDSAHLRTRVPLDGMNYKGFNIAMHELGHNVEQVISNSMIDHHSMNGVPNTAFTENFAFLFQARDLEILGLSASDPKFEAWDTLNEFWMTYEIAGVALMDMKVWHWLYDHPDSTPAQLKEAVIRIAKEVWNSYYADVFKVKDLPQLAIYSHMINSGLYLPDYPIGHIISFQMKEYLRDKTLGPEMVHMCKQGVYIPDLWMKKAVGAPLSAEPLLAAAERALKTAEAK